jgi:glutamate-ammonia-ligase adenylyltransferase
VQALQLIRGGREPALRDRACCRHCARWSRRGTDAATGGMLLAEAYRFLRRLENRLQMLRDAQTHALPGRRADRARIARGLGYPRLAGLLEALAVQRERVSAEFAALLAPRRADAAAMRPGRRTGAACPTAAMARAGRAGFEMRARPDAQLRDFARAPACARCPMPRARAWIACCRRC